VPWTPERYFSWHKFYDYNSGIIGNLLPHTFLPLMLATAIRKYRAAWRLLALAKFQPTAKSRIRLHLLAEFPSGLTFCVAGTTVNEQGWANNFARAQRHPLFLQHRQSRRIQTRTHFLGRNWSRKNSRGPLKLADIPRLEKNWFECIRNGGTPLAKRRPLPCALTLLLALAEMAERLSLTLLFDEKTRTVEDRRWPRGQTAQLRHSFARKSRLSADAGFGDRPSGPRQQR